MSALTTTKTRRPWPMTVFGGEDLGDVFGDRLWPEWTRLAGEEWTPAISFYEKEGKFHLEADVPGFSKDQISVEVDNGVLTISGKKEEAREEKDVRYFHREIRSGSFSRSMRLPGDVDPEKIEASYKNGQLQLIMPKNESKKITVK